MKLGFVVAALFGLVVATGVVAVVGFRHVVDAVRAMGWTGFAAFCAVSTLLFPLLGGAWFAVAPGQAPKRFWTFTWGRMVRDAVSDILPLSQIGGLVLGAREVVERGVRAPLGYASTLVDLATELAAQLLYTIYGVAFLIWLGLETAGSRNLVTAGLGGLALATIFTAALVVAQRFGGRIVVWLAPRWFPSAISGATAVQAALDEIFRHPGRLAVSVLLHLAAWVGAGAAAWLALSFMGLDLSLPRVLAIESLLYAVRGFAFMIPNAIGVQEGAYALIGPLLGLPAESAIALSLLKRARDLVIGVPPLLVWQAMEGRRLLGRTPVAEAGASGR